MAIFRRFHKTYKWTLEALDNTPVSYVLDMLVLADLIDNGPEIDDIW